MMIKDWKLDRITKHPYGYNHWESMQNKTHEI